VLVQVIDPQRGLYIVLPASGVAGPEAVGAFAPKGGLVPVFTGPAFGSITIAPGPTPAPPGTKPVDRQTLRVVTDQAFVVAAPPPAAGDVIFVRDRGYVNLGLRPTSGEVIIVQDVGVIIAFRPPASGDYLRVRDGTILTVTPPVEKVVPPGSTQAQVIVTDLAYTAIGIRPTSGASIRIADQSIVGTLTPQRLADAILVQDRSYLVASVPPSGLTTVTVTDQARITPSVSSVSRSGQNVIVVSDIAEVLYGIGHLLFSSITVSDASRVVASSPVRAPGPDLIVVSDVAFVAKSVILVALQRVSIFDSSFITIHRYVSVSDLVSVSDASSLHITPPAGWVSGTSYPTLAGGASVMTLAYNSSANLSYGVDGTDPGNPGAGNTNLVYAYSASAGTWTQEANDLVTGGARACSLGSFVYRVTWSASQATQETTGYNTSTNVWTQEATMPSHGSYYDINIPFGSEQTANLAYVVGGVYYNGSTYVLDNETYAYSPSSNTWTSETNYPIAVQGANLVGIPSTKTVMVFGGQNSTFGPGGTGQVANTYSLNETSGSWTSEANLITAVDSHGAVYDSGANLVYAVDGERASGIVNYMQAWNPSTNSWTNEPNDLVSRLLLGATYDSSAARSYAVGGFTALWTSTSDMDIYNA